MEVHGHTHTERKKWTHYFWEFLMLFLAVTLGFFVENQREHYVEHQRVKEYARQMITDLKDDTAFLNQLLKDLNDHVTAFDTVNLLFDKTPPVSNKRLLQAVLKQRTTYPQQLSATTFSQMKSSGTIRYFRNADLSRRVSNYYDKEQIFLNVAIAYANNFFTTDLQSFMLTHFDYSESDYFGDTLKVEKPVYLHRSSETDLLLRNKLILYTSQLRWNMNYPASRVLNRAIQLIELLKKEYHLK